MPPAAYTLPQAWGVLHREITQVGQAVAIAVGNLNARIEQAYGAGQEDMAGIMYGMHVRLAAPIVAVDKAVSVPAGRVTKAMEPAVNDVYVGVQAVHDALYNRLAAGINALGGL